MVKVDGTEQRPVARVGDIELYRWDVDLLQPRQWLNDALIAFVFEHMTQGLSEADGVVLIEPTVAFSAAMVPPDVLGEMLSGGPSGQERLARLRQARLVVLPVNDNQDAERASGGGHWSCLAFRRLGADAAQFEHYDSSNDANEVAARAIARTFGELLLSSGLETPFRTMATPQQTNGARPPFESCYWRSVDGNAHGSPRSQEASTPALSAQDTTAACTLSASRRRLVQIPSRVGSAHRRRRRRRCRGSRPPESARSARSC